MLEMKQNPSRIFNVAQHWYNVGVQRRSNRCSALHNVVLTLFANNQMKANPGKCHLLTSSSDKVSICLDNYNIKSNKCEKLLGIKIDNKINQ